MYFCSCAVFITQRLSLYHWEDIRLLWYMYTLLCTVERIFGVRFWSNFINLTSYLGRLGNILSSNTYYLEARFRCGRDIVKAIESFSSKSLKRINCIYL